MREPTALISTEALARDLGDGGLRIFDCTTFLEPPPPGSDDPYVALPGRSTFEAAHIPGADFLDLQGEFSDNTTRLRFMMPSVAEYSRPPSDVTASVLMPASCSTASAR
jgi:thiosulfate/3-mercaptopyruvate sulfurtransferase